MIPAKVAIYAAVTPVDLRRSFDGLSAAARDVLTGRKPSRYPVDPSWLA